MLKKGNMIKKILGFGCIIIGILGIFLPIIPGWLLIFGGFAIMEGKSFIKIVRKAWKKIKSKT
ncbi:PGPGW domain-containing protein [Nanoarchaeota archaeon]